MHEVKFRNYRKGVKHIQSIGFLYLRVVPVIGHLFNATSLTSERMVSGFHIAETRFFEGPQLHFLTVSSSNSVVRA